jgi:alkylmercury lyase
MSISEQESSRVEGHVVDLDRLAARAIASTPALDPAQARVAVGLYRLLAEGEPVSTHALAERLGLAPEEVAATVALLPAVFRDGDGRVIGFWGLAIPEMSPTHRLEVEGRTFYAWCAADTLFLPRVIGKTARVDSTFPTSGDPISLVVSPDRIESVSVEGAALSFVRSEGRQIDDAIISTFCHQILFFPSEEEGRRWAHSRDDVVILPIEVGFELTRRWTDAVFGAPIRGDRQR